MTFGLLPAWWAWAALIAACVVAATAFLIRPRPARHTVSSLLIWRTVLDDARERSLWERVRWFVSLAATVLIALALALALLEPVAGRSMAVGGRVLIVLDSSWTMRAERPSGGTRWVQAVREAWAITQAASGHEVVIATTAEGIVEGPTRDVNRVRAALDRLTPSGGPDAAWPRVSGTEAVHLITDGAAARSRESGVTEHSVFLPAPNVAIAAFDVEELPSNEAHVFVAVTNHSAAGQTVDVSLTRASAVIGKRSVRIGAGSTFRDDVVVPLEGDARFHASVSAPANALAIDDEAAAWLWGASPLSVGVVGTGPIAPLLAEDRSLRVTVFEPASYAGSTQDVWVFNHWLPSTPPTKPALVIDPPASAWLGNVKTGGAVSSWRAESHPVLNGVDASLVRIAATRTVEGPAMEAIAVSESGSPLVSVEDAATRLVLFAFSLADSNLSMTPAFPVLLGNAIDWIGRPERGRERRPGPVVLPSDTARVIAPDGRSLPRVNLDRRVITVLEKPGLYLAESTGAPRVMNVELGEPRRSNLLVSSVAEDTSVRAGASTSVASWWVVAAWVALAGLGVEWLTWQRRVTV